MGAVSSGLDCCTTIAASPGQSDSATSSKAKASPTVITTALPAVSTALDNDERPVFPSRSAPPSLAIGSLRTYAWAPAAVEAQSLIASAPKKDGSFVQADFPSPVSAEPVVIASQNDDGWSSPASSQWSPTTSRSPQSGASSDSSFNNYELMWACAYGDEAKVRHLLEQCKPWVSRICDTQGFFLMHFACASGNLQLVQLLARFPYWADCKVRATGAVNHTPVVVAALYGHCQVVEYLAQSHGALNAPGAPPDWSAWDHLLPLDENQICAPLVPRLPGRLGQHLQATKSLHPTESLLSRRAVRIWLQEQFGIPASPIFTPEAKRCLETKQSDCDGLLWRSEGSALSTQRPMDDARGISLSMTSFSTSTESQDPSVPLYISSRLRDRRGLNSLLVQTSNWRSE